MKRGEKGKSKVWKGMIQGQYARDLLLHTGGLASTAVGRSSQKGLQKKPKRKY